MGGSRLRPCARGKRAMQCHSNSGLTTYPSGIGGRYHRVSTTKQDTERQIADIDRWLARGGITAQHVFEDHAPRDKAEERLQFQAMLGMVQARSLDWVVIQSIDRFGFKD